MKTLHKLLFPVMLLSLALASASLAGCTVHTQTPAVTVVDPAPVAVTYAAAPARVYHNGRWLYYRNGGYYYVHRGRWVVAPVVPAHVVRYHRPHVRVVL